jgi:hypothetical protein
MSTYMALRPSADLSGTSGKLASDINTISLERDLNTDSPRAYSQTCRKFPLSGVPPMSYVSPKPLPRGPCLE